MKSVTVLLGLLLTALPLSAQSARSACDGSAAALQSEVLALNAALVAALKSDPREVARYYSDDATIVGGGMRATGRAEIDRYWGGGPTPQDWKLELVDVGGSCDSLWQRGLSTLVSASGRNMVTEFVTVMKRDAGGALRIHLDMYVAAPPRP